MNRSIISNLLRSAVLLLFLFLNFGLEAAVHVPASESAVIKQPHMPKAEKKAARKMARAEKKGKTHAILSFLCGLAATGLLVTLINSLFFLAVPLGLIAIFFGIRSTRREGKSLLSTLGMLLGGIALIGGTIFIIGIIMG